MKLHGGMINDVIGAKQLRIPDAWLVLRFLHAPVFLGLLAACAVFCWIAFGGSGEADGDAEAGGSR